MKPDSGEIAERISRIGEGTVTWKGLVQTSLVVGSLLAMIGCSIWSQDVAHEARQNAEIKEKADKQELVDAVRSLERWIQRGIAELERRDKKLVGQVQNQEQSINVTDMVSEAAKQDFALRWQRQMAREYGPCVIGDQDGVRNGIRGHAEQVDGVFSSQSRAGGK